VGVRMAHLRFRLLGSLVNGAQVWYNLTTVGMTGFDGKGWSRIASRGALSPLTMEHTFLSANNTWIPVPQVAMAAAPMVA